MPQCVIGRSPIRRMPFAEAETALASTIGQLLDPRAIHETIRAPGARWIGSTTFQRLTRRLNDLAFSSLRSNAANDGRLHGALGSPSFLVTLYELSSRAKRGTLGLCRRN